MFLATQVLSICHLVFMSWAGLLMQHASPVNSLCGEKQFQEKAKFACRSNSKEASNVLYVCLRKITKFGAFLLNPFLLQI